MKRLVLFALLFICIGLLFQNSYACSCGVAESTEKDPQKIKESVRKFYLKEFKGAVFTGKVLAGEQVEEKIDDTRFTLRKKISIQVEKYWLGVKKPMMTIYTGIGGGDCGVNFEKGKSYFFIPQYVQGVLTTGICDYFTKEGMSADGESVKYFNEILGKAKTFKKKNKQ